MAKITRTLNRISDVNKAFGDITGAYTTLVDLGTEYEYSRFNVRSTFDEPITLRFGSASAGTELIVNAAMQIDLPNFIHNNIVSYKHNGAAPTSGALKALSW